jgi:fibronectin type 3 domain-containing protein
MRTIVWVGLGILALNVLLIGVLAFIGLIRRIQIARTQRELERLGFLVRLAYTPETRPIWPRWVEGFAGLVALIITTSVLTAAPSARTQASTAGSSLQGAPIHATVVPPGTNPGSEYPASLNPTASQGVASPQASAASSASLAVDAGSDTGAPSAVAAVPTSATAIRLEWAPVSDAARYDIERSTDSVAWNAVASTGGGQTAYTDVALSSGATYYYRVVAFVDGQDASRSDAVSATTTVETSTTPVFISATGSPTSIELEWSDVDAELGYRIERSADGTTGWTAIGTTGQDVTSFTDTGLASATSYYYRVVAVTSDGESPPSTVRSATTDLEGPSISDANVTASEAPSDPDL